MRIRPSTCRYTSSDTSSLSCLPGVGIDDHGVVGAGAELILYASNQGRVEGVREVGEDDADKVRAERFEAPGEGVGPVLQLLDDLSNTCSCGPSHGPGPVEDLRHGGRAHPSRVGNIPYCRPSTSYAQTAPRCSRRRATPSSRALPPTLLCKTFCITDAYTLRRGHKLVKAPPVPASTGPGQAVGGGVVRRSFGHVGVHNGCGQT